MSPSLPGTIYSAAAEIEGAGGRALPVVCDIRSEEQVVEAVRKGVERFGGFAPRCSPNAVARNRLEARIS